MSEWTRIRRVVVPLALIVLVLATAAGMVCHHHNHTSSDGCVLCHLAIATPPEVESDTSLLVPVATPVAVEIDDFISRYLADQKPSRAPPA